MKITKKSLALSIFAITLLLLDQFSKLYLMQYLPRLPGEQVQILPFLKFVFSWNRGVSFGMFSGWEHSNKFFLLLNAAIISYLLYFQYHLSDKWQKIAIIMVISGACGNLIDRILHDAVFDFIHFYYQQYHFPTFNPADAFISVGVFLYLLRSIMGTHKQNSPL